jgi:predicted DNA-binding transcriptional regulator AlpA
VYGPAVALDVGMGTPDRFLSRPRDRKVCERSGKCPCPVSDGRERPQGARRYWVYGASLKLLGRFGLLTVNKCMEHGPYSDERRAHRSPERFVCRRELAEIMGVSLATVDRLVAEGMPSVTWGRRTRRFRPSAAISWASARERAA